MRIEKALDFLEAIGLDCGIVLKPENIFYLTGFFPSAYSALLLKSEPLLLVSRIDSALAGRASVEFRVVEKVEKEFETLKYKKIGIEKKYASIDFYEKYLRKKEIVDLDFIEKMRLIKDRGEIKKIEKAVRIAEEAMEKAFKILEDAKDRTEVEVVAEVEHFIRRNANMAFDTIVASGKNSSIPHHQPSKQKLGQGDSIIVDLGAKVEYYNSDITRTFCLEPSREFSEVYGIVREAQRAGIKEVREGNEICKADEAVRGVFDDYGLEEHLLHSSGHGVGLEVHESPKIEKENKEKFKKGMVVTIEPGIYKNFGIRIEDMILVGKKPRLLTNVWK